MSCFTFIVFPMILLELNPLSPPVAISEMVVILLAAAVIGYLIGRWITKGQIRSLRQVLEKKEGELGDCQAQQQLPDTFRNNKPPVDATVVRDDLKLIEGIGPAIEKLLNAADIFSFSQLAATPEETLTTILHNAGPRFRIHDPGSWPRQAALARDGKWEELDELQDILTGGRDTE